jgi:3-isopropylmalate/(R)-2-methylmalate dehydratase large subunit
MGRTIAEKIIGEHCGRQVEPGELVIVDVDVAMATDATAPQAISAFEEMGGERVWDPERVVLVLDHASPAPNEKVANLHRMMRGFASRTGCVFYETGAGIAHHLLLDEGHVRPGNLVLGADSHTCTHGAVGAFATGVGSTDIAGVFLTGKTWLRVPETIRVELDGRPGLGVGAKDLALHVVGTLGISGATYQVIEYCGEAVSHLSLAGRITLANMTAEMGGKAGVVSPAGLELSGSIEVGPLPDADATYARTVTLEVSQLPPQIALPGSPQNVRPLSDVAGTPIDVAYLGTCTNARIDDLRAAAAVLNGKHVSPGVRLLVQPASRRALDQALEEGVYRALSDAGAVFLTTGCGPCVGTHQGIPGDGEVVISTANRNFPGRMGNRQAEVYLGSPVAVAAAALRGEITDPRTCL